MKRILLFLLLIPALLHAQSEKYMEGAVPEVNGKVVFTRNLNVPSFSQEQIYNAVLDWSHHQFTEKGCSILYSDAQKGVIAIQGLEQFVVKIGLFPGKVNIHYMQTIRCANGVCTFETSRVRYTNNPSSKNSTDIIVAEEYITDKYALNKAKTKIFNGTGDYRKKTIDMVDRLAADGQNAIYSYNGQTLYPAAVQPAYTAMQPQQPAAVQPQQTAVQPVQAAVQPQQNSAQPAKVAVPASTEGMKSIAVQQIPAKLLDAVSANGFYITAVDGRTLANAIAGKGGLDIDMNTGEGAAMFSITENTDNILYLLEKAGSYTLVLYENTPAGGVSQTPDLVIECKKSQQFDKLFVGDITDMKVK